MGQAAQTDAPGSPDTAAAAAIEAAVEAAVPGAPAELRASALEFASVLTEAVVRQLVNPKALKQSALDGTKVTKAVAKGQNKRAKAKRPTRTDKYNPFLLYASLMGAHTGVRALNAIGASWSGLDEEQKQLVKTRLQAVLPTVNEQVRAASSDKVNVAELLAAYEAQHGLAALDWAGMIAPYTAMPNNSGRKKRPGKETGSPTPKKHKQHREVSNYKHKQQPHPANQIML